MSKDIISVLFSDENYDHKNIINRSQQEVPLDFINKLEKGIDSEELEALGLPVFRYKTQITIHGIFTKVDTIRVGDYKHIFQNQNLSIGARYAAIDYGKKREVYTMICKFNKPWYLHETSTEMYIYREIPISNKAEIDMAFAELQKDLERLNKNLFTGEVLIQLVKVPYMGIRVQAVVNIQAIKKENMVPVIEALTPYSYQEMIDILEQEAQQEKAIREAKEKTEKEIRERYEKEAPARIKALDTWLEKQGLIKVEKQELKNGMVMVKGYVTATLVYQIHFYSFKKSPKQRQWRYHKAVVVYPTLNTALTDPLHYDYSERKLKQGVSTATGWFYKAALEQAKEEPPTTEINNYTIQEYSPRAFCLLGNTKKLKDILSQYGTWMSRSKVGPCWVFPNYRRNEVESLLSHLK